MLRRGSKHGSAVVEPDVTIESSNPDKGGSAMRAAESETSSCSAAAAMPLESLTPSFDEDHHGTYLRRLEEAVKDPDNLNIALTGRYGAGKSSVLDKFEDNHRKSTQRLAISTLAPGEEGETTTNRIQKEIVKQLLYGATEKVGKNSRFSRIAVFSKRRAFMESAVVVACLGGLLYLFGGLPEMRVGADWDSWVRAAAWIGAGVLLAALLTPARTATYGRFRVSDVSAGGAALTLTEKPDTFFDLYLDEIVHYFGQESKDIVIFEDLDRFEDPHIFEALRELNVLLNETPERRRKRRGNRVGRALSGMLAFFSEDLRDEVAAKLSHRWGTRLLGLGVPLRFVYAVKDSVFEKIDADTAMTVTSDAATAETLRANRTKFFDIVIPIVPFISHRNARDLLLGLLNRRGIVGIEPRLINTIAQHCTDMRLMRNICNEYLVFAERLLEPKEPNKPAPEMDASRLFALVTYKNFHLEDFENITRRDSDLDRLYGFHQRLVRDTIAAKERRKRALIEEPERYRARETLAELLGERLELHASWVRRASSTDFQQCTSHRFKVGEEEFASGQVSSYDFWSTVATTRSVDIVLSMQSSAQTRTVALDEDTLAVFAPECLDAQRWADYDADTIRTELGDVERDVKQLRRAGFAELTAMPQFELIPDPDSGSEQQTFAQLLGTTLKSELARDLIRRGYIDRNFSLYAAQFYGNFTGVDVANFMVQHVQSNTMAIDYDLSREGAVANLLTEAEDAGQELTRLNAALNIDIVNHLLISDHPGAVDVAKNIIAGWGSQEVRAFLGAYFTTESAEREKLAALLAEHRWREVFIYLVNDDDVPADARVALVDAAARGFDPDAAYDLDDNVRVFITAHYHAMRTFTQDHLADSVGQAAERLPERLNMLLDRTGVVIPGLQLLGKQLHELVVGANRYELTADNLRSAVRTTGDVSLDHIHENETVYANCLDQLPSYLATIDHDPKTDHAVTTSACLTNVLKDMVEDWSEDQVADPDTGGIADLLARTSPDARLPSLQTAPESTWTALAAADRFRASLANMSSYRTHVGSIDIYLAELLQRAGTVYTSEPDDVTDPGGDQYDRQNASIALLNTTHLAPEVRVDLVASLEPATPLPLENVNAETSDLFARLLERGMIADEAETFTHIRAGGWSAVGPAVRASNNIGAFLEPAHMAGMIRDLLNDSDAAAKLGRIVLSNVEEYVPDDEWLSLKAVGDYADIQGIALTPDTATRIARVAPQKGLFYRQLLLRLLGAADPLASPDDIVAVFEKVGPAYDQIQRTGEKLTFVRDDLHDQLLKVLSDAGRISRGYPRKGYSATVL